MHSVETYQENELTCNLSRNACPQLPKLAEPQWTDQSLKSRLWCAWADLHFKKKGLVGSDLSTPPPPYIPHKYEQSYHYCEYSDMNTPDAGHCGLARMTQHFTRILVRESLPLVKFWQSVEIDVHPPCVPAWTGTAWDADCKHTAQREVEAETLTVAGNFTANTAK